MEQDLKEGQGVKEELSETFEEKGQINRVIKITALVLLVTLGVFLIWAGFFPIDQGAPAVGQVTVANYKKVIQHQYGGTVKDILVNEGDQVKRAQVLIRLEDSEIRARYAAIKAEYTSALVVYARLQAERANLASIVYPREVLQWQRDPEIKRLMHLQESLFQARRSKLESEKRVLLESTKGLQDYADNLKRQRDYYQNQLKIVEGQLESLKGLLREGYYPKNRYLELERVAEELKGKVVEIAANQQKAEAGVRENQLRISVLEKEYYKEVEAELAEVEKRIAALKDNYHAIVDVLEKTEIRSPDDGIVMALKVHTIGQVIQPGQTIMEIVPKGSELIVEGKLSSVYMENVKVGQMVDLRFISLDPKKTPVLEGKLIYVSPDALFDEVTRASFYLIKVQIKEESLEGLKKLNKEIVPGLPVQIVVKTGKRTFLSYLLKPFLDRLAFSFLK